MSFHRPPDPYHEKLTSHKKCPHSLCQHQYMISATCHWLSTCFKHPKLWLLPIAFMLPETHLSLQTSWHFHRSGTVTEMLSVVSLLPVCILSTALVLLQAEAVHLVQAHCLAPAGGCRPLLLLPHQQRACWVHSIPSPRLLMEMLNQHLEGCSSVPWLQLTHWEPRN